MKVIPCWLAVNGYQMTKTIETPSLESLFGKKFRCQCGRTHEVPVRVVHYAEDALLVLPHIFASHTQGQSVTILSDVRTHEVAGIEAASSLAQAGWQVESVVVPDGDRGSPLCDDQTFNALLQKVGRPDGLIAVGSGVINDLTKWLSFEIKVPYVAFATAATMNGYTAANVAATIDGVKQLVHAQAPVAVLAVPSMIARAPFELTAAGLGDAVAKPVSVTDWRINHWFFNEYYCPYCAGIISEIESLYYDNPQEVGMRTPDGVRAVFDALIYSGLAMTLIGTSAPASGGEHLFSHTLDMMGLVDGLSGDLHGRQVGLGTILAAALYERIQGLSSPDLCDMPGSVDQAFWGHLAGPVTAQYEAKKDRLKQMRARLSEPSEWQNLQDIVRGNAKGPKMIADCLASAGAARYIEDIRCTRERVRVAVLHMHEIRQRTTVVDLAWLVGILPASAEEIIEEWLEP
jgi:glycerol-1-phosphate dehydrogenase [NAD(P)+]